MYSIVIITEECRRRLNLTRALGLILGAEINCITKHSKLKSNMFKKNQALVERSNTLLKNKEIRNLKQSVLKNFGINTDEQAAFKYGFSEEDLSLLIPNKGNVSVKKLISKTLIYCCDDVPLFIDLNDRNDLCPTLFSLWAFRDNYSTCFTQSDFDSSKIRDKIRTVVIHPPVSEYLLNGADLMIPGLISLDRNVIHIN